MKREGNICIWYLTLEGRCFLNGSGCYSPFSCEGCDIQCRDIFYRNPPEKHKHYEPSETDEKTTKSELWKVLRIKKNDIVAEMIIPYDEMEIFNADPSIIIHKAMEQVKEKISEAKMKMTFIRAFHNVEILKGVYGVYVIGVSKQN